MAGGYGAREEGGIQDRAVYPGGCRCSGLPAAGHSRGQFSVTETGGLAAVASAGNFRVPHDRGRVVNLLADIVLLTERV